MKPSFAACSSRPQLLTALMVSLLTTFATADEAVIERLAVEPNTCYRLKFDAKIEEGSATWFLNTIDQQGDAPFAGSHHDAWQKIVPERTHYSHAFRSAPDAATLLFTVRYEGQTPQVSDVQLDRVTPEGLFINGDFLEGPGNYSGWSEHLNTHFIEVDGKTALKIEHNGYALTDRIPVVGGADYRFDAGSTMPTYVLGYDIDMHLMTPTPYHRKRELKTPEQAAYLRLLYQTSFDHIPAYRTKTITSVGLQPVDANAIATVTDLPLYPGEVVLDSEADPREERAANELRHWIREITGKRLVLLTKPSKRNNTKIYLGAKWAKEYQQDLDYLAESDGYAVRRSGNEIFVFGSHPRGTLFGVYALLEKNTDIIWPRPHPDFTALYSHVPEIEFSQTDIVSRPAFKVREINFFGGDPNPVISHEWIGRNGGNTPTKLGKGFGYLHWLSGATIGAGGGYIWTFIGLDQKDETLYPLVNGNRLRNMWRQPCYTHPDVPKVMAQTAREILESVPGRQLEFLISRVGDNWEVCSCPECMQPITLADGSQLHAKSTSSIKDPLFFSTRNYMMLNRMAEELVKDYPDLELHTHAYIFAAEPPKVKIHPAIVPHFAAYPTKNERYPILEQPSEPGAMWGRRMRQWSEEQDVKFGFFGYYYGEGFNALADTAGPDYKALAEMGGVHAHCEGFPGDTGDLNSWDFDGCEKWIIAKLQWDPTLNPADLRDEYITRSYRDASAPMRQFYQLINDSWHDSTNPTTVNCHTPAKELFQKFIVDPGLEKRLRVLLLEAQAIASDSKSKRLIERVLAKFDQLAAGLNRLLVPLVPESTEQWSQYDSPHWYKAHEIDGFKRIANAQPIAENSPAPQQTTVVMMRDKDQLYFKIDAFTSGDSDAAPPQPSDAFPQGDRVEMVLRSGRDTYYFAIGEDHGTYLLKNWSTTRPWSNQVQVQYLRGEGRWSALVAVPLKDIGADRGSIDIDGKFSRVVHPATTDREESTYDGRGIFNDHTLLRSPLQFD
ncbi:DUF4838 domain-containing protein [Novipirellula sp. SH528]|uniref:DUF4838 domain-containing protein n=1 Tax=Novipirellula sp. SH528 TaxID=3454466 RepID=UPI003FA0D59F